MTELLDIVNENDEVIWTITKDEIYEWKHIHRVIHILVFNSEKKIALQLRSKDEKFLPWYVFASVCWHVSAWEHYEEWAYREMQEELWINTPLKFLWKQLYYDNEMHKFQAVFEAEYDWKISHDVWEIEEIVYLSLSEIQQMISEWRKFQPELIHIFKTYYNI